jgi:PmbA protein
MLGMIDELLKRSKDYGFDEAEVMVMEDKNFETTVYKNEVDNYSVSENFGLSFRGLINDVMGYAYTEKIDEKSIEMLLENAMNNLKNIDSKDKEILFSNKENIEYVKINQYNDELNNVTNDMKIEILKKMEKAAYDYDKRVKSVNHCLFENGETSIRIKNTLGLDVYEKSNVLFCFISVGVEANKEIQTSYSLFVGNDIKSLNGKKLAYEAVDKAVKLLGAKTMESDNYPVIIENTTFASLIEAFSPIFSAEQVQKGFSLLKGKISKKVAIKKLNIIDNPHFIGKIASCSFDAEGVPTKYKEVIKNGVLTTYLHNMKTANIDGVKSTGNATRSSYKSSVGIAPSNFYVKNGKSNIKDMISKIDIGILIVSLEGLHAGINSISGDFSLSAKGFLIERGKIIRAVNQITVSGNFLNVLKNIEDIGNDLDFGIPSGSSLIGSPSIKISSLTVSGN